MKLGIAKGAVRPNSSSGWRLLGGVSAIALSAFALAAPAFAQQAEDASDEATEEIVVTGMRASVASAQEIKRDAEVIVDSITAVDIGALPDRSVSEALQRIPGITLQRTNENRDPARLASEGGAVFVRGLSWVRSELNGRDVFSANNGRGLSFEDVSADLLSGVDVYKNPSAEQIEGGIGGIVNLRTRLPFDQQGRLIAGSFDYNYGDLFEEGFASGSVLYSDRWDTSAGDFGLLLAYSENNIGNRTDSIQTSRYEPHILGTTIDGLSAGTQVWIPTALAARRIDWEQERTAIGGALQWASPDDRLQLTLQALTARAQPVSIERRFGDESDSFRNDNPTYQFDDDNVLQAGTIANASYVAGMRYGADDKETTDYGLNIRFLPNDRWAFGADIQAVESSALVYSLTVDSQFGIAQWSGMRPNLEFDTSGDDPFTVQVPQGSTPPGAAEDQGSYWWANAMDHIERNDAESIALRLDGEYSFENDSFLRSFRFGARITDRAAVTRQTGWNWGILSQQFWGGIGGMQPVFLDQTGFASFPNGGWGGSVPVTGVTNPDLPGYSSLYTFANFMRGDTAHPGVGWFPSVDLLSQGTGFAYQQLQAAGAGTPDAWVPLNIRAGCAPEDQYCDAMFAAAGPAGDNVSGGVAQQDEQTTAYYAVLRFGLEETPLGRMDGAIGVRHVITDNTALGNLIVGSLAGGTPANCAAAAATVNGDADPANNLDCTAFDEYYQFSNNGAGFADPGASQRSSYENTLPSLNVRFHLTDDVQLRFAAARALVRPSFSQMVPNITISEDFGFTPCASPPCAPDVAHNFRPDDSSPVDVVGGNPDLRPTVSDQFDVSLEWYFAPTGSLTFAGFYKDIQDFIFSSTETETFTAGGNTGTFPATRNRNGEDGTVQGFEIAYTQFYDFLPGPLAGLGLQANFTYIDSSGGANTAVNPNDPNQVIAAALSALPLEGMSRTSYNVTGMYEMYGIEARLAYNWRESYLLTTSAANINRPVWYDDYGQLDGSIFYSINDHWKIGVQGTNLLNERTELLVSSDLLNPETFRQSYSWTDTDRRIAFVARARY